ncbi:MAG: type II secretion system F family protein [Alphaproteobacteria bacterium]|nr:type II secretion system F family protein [Alphaproteobacteria bacterium]
MFGLSASIVIPVIVGILVFTGYMAISSRLTKKSNVSEKIKKLAATGQEMADMSAALAASNEPSQLAQSLEPLLAAIGVNMKKIRGEFQLKMLQSGIQSPDAPVYYAAMKNIGGPVLAVIALIMLAMDSQGLEKVGTVFMALVMMVVGIWGPDMYLKNRKDKRQKVLQRSFPDALDLILVCVESGLALDAALSRVCRELELAHPEITKEFNKTRMELTLLNDRERALHNLSERTDMMAFRALVSALLQSEKFGTSLTETLRVLSEDYRHTRLMIAENKAGKLPALMTIPMMLLLLPALMLVLMGPAMLTLVSMWKN